MQSGIYDAYVEWLQAQKKNKEKQKGVHLKRDDSSKRTVLMESQVNKVLPACFHLGIYTQKLTTDLMFIFEGI